MALPSTCWSWHDERFCEQAHPLCCLQPRRLPAGRATRLDRRALRNEQLLWKLCQEAVRVVVKLVLDHTEIQLGLALLPHAQRLALHDVSEHEQLVTPERFPLRAAIPERCLGEGMHGVDPPDVVAPVLVVLVKRRGPPRQGIPL